jgi:hypothetical protein
MIAIGLVLALLGYFLPVPILLDLGVLLIVVGVILWFVPIRGQYHRWY